MARAGLVGFLACQAFDRELNARFLVIGKILVRIKRENGFLARAVLQCSKVKSRTSVRPLLI